MKSLKDLKKPDGGFDYSKMEKNTVYVLNEQDVTSPPDMRTAIKDAKVIRQREEELGGKFQVKEEQGRLKMWIS